MDSSCKDIICDANVIFEALVNSVKGSKFKASSQKYMIHSLKEIFSLQDDLLNQTYKPGKEHRFMINERGKIRPITSLETRDRIVRHILCDDIFLPVIRNKLIYDNGASLPGKGISFTRKRFETHLHRYFLNNGTNEGYIGFGDFSKFYDNIIHSIIKEELLRLYDHDEYLEWLLNIIFDNFVVDVSYMSDEEYSSCITDLFNSIEYRNIPKELLTGEKFMKKSVNIGDQISQVIGIFYPNRIDHYVKTVRSQKYYGRYMDDWYIINRSKEELHDIFNGISEIASELGIHMNHNKTRIVKLDSVYKFLQIKYTLTDTGRIITRLNPKRVTSFRRKLKKLNKKVLDENLPYSAVESSFKSWMGSFYKYMSKKQRHNMIKLYERLFDKKVSIVNKKLVIS